MGRNKTANVGKAMLPTPRCLQERRRTDDCAKLAGARGHCVCEEEYVSSFIPYLEYLSKVSMTVTYRQRQEHSHFVGASLSLARSLSLSLPPSLSLCVVLAVFGHAAPRRHVTATVFKGAPFEGNCLRFGALPRRCKVGQTHKRVCEREGRVLPGPGERSHGPGCERLDWGGAHLASKWACCWSKESRSRARPKFTRAIETRFLCSGSTP